ncbi:MAG: glutaredoxin [Halobacteriovoraceae bacterium]|jgi:glutaredoxin|nr:glutaredoxin [Halobacteriovoraceae bacterium]
MKIIRLFVGMILIFLDKITSPRPLAIDSLERDKIIEKSKGMALYQFNACPFCIKVRRFMKANNIEIPLRDAMNIENFRQELLKEGGKIKAPCLKIVRDDKSQWLYESNDIISFLEREVLA